MIGLFGIGESLNQLSLTPAPNRKRDYNQKSVRNSDFAVEDPSAPKRMSLKEIWDTKIAFLLTVAISVIVGAIPGTGGDIAAIVSWEGL